MPTYAVTGASGHLGRLVVEDLLARGVPAADIVAIVRTPAKAADLAERGVDVRHGDYSRPDTLSAALAGVRRLLLVSGSEPGRRVAQHTAVIQAARAAGVERILYTSILRADTSTNPLAPDHNATEQILLRSGVPSTRLRNSWYIENYTAQLDQYLESGEIVDDADSGRISGALRVDYAAAAGAALTEDVAGDIVYELGGTAPFTLAELADTITEVTGTKVLYHDLSPAEFVVALQRAGLDPGVAVFLADIGESIAHGDLETTSDDLTRLLGRPSTPLAEAIRAARPVDKAKL
jgi:NAD(P)H dehydrogenase (quinone)